MTRLIEKTLPSFAFPFGFPITKWGLTTCFIRTVSLGMKPPPRLCHRIILFRLFSFLMSDKSFHLHSLSSGEKLIQLASDSLVTEILIQPQLSTLKQCMRNLLASFTRHRHVIHAGYTLSGPGSWILQVWWPFTHSLFWWCRPRKCSCLSFRFFFFLGRYVRIQRLFAHCARCRNPADLSSLRIEHHDGSPLRRRGSMERRPDQSRSSHQSGQGNETFPYPLRM